MTVDMTAEEGPLTQSEVDRIIGQELTDEYEKLRHTPGFCIDAVSWERLMELIQLGTEEALGKLGRTPAGIRAYWNFRAQVLDDYRSIADYVRITKLDFEVLHGEDGVKRAGQPPPDEDGRPHITFRANDFPYNFDEGMEHHNIWCTRPLTDEEVAEVIKQHRAGWEVLVFRNPESLASIPSVWHNHIISRRPRHGQ